MRGGWALKGDILVRHGIPNEVHKVMTGLAHRLTAMIPDNRQRLPVPPPNDLYPL